LRPSVRCQDGRTSSGSNSFVALTDGGGIADDGGAGSEDDGGAGAEDDGGVEDRTGGRVGWESELVTLLATTPLSSWADTVGRAGGGGGGCCFLRKTADMAAGACWGHVLDVFLASPFEPWRGADGGEMAGCILGGGGSWSEGRDNVSATTIMAPLMCLMSVEYSLM